MDPPCPRNYREIDPLNAFCLQNTIAPKFARRVRDMRGVQRELFGKFPLEYGGDVSRGKRKTMRPFDRKRVVHATFRASSATRAWSMCDEKHKGHIYIEAHRITDESNVKLYRCVNVGNHIHAVFKARSRRDFQRFLRVFSGRVAMLVTGARKGKPLEKRFWDLIVHTKLIAWGKQFTNVSRYMEKNLREAEGANAVLIMRDFEIRTRATESWA